MRFRFAQILAIAFSLWLVAIASAQPVPTLSGLTPIYFKQGESREVTLTGGNLGTVTSAVVIGAKGLSADLITPDKPNPSQAKLKLTVAVSAPLGDRELRLVTALGVTPPLTVTVGQYTATEDKEPNNSPEQATPLKFPSSIIGRIETSGDVDSFRFDAKKDQHLIFDLYASRLGSAFDPVIVILDAAGKEQPKTTSFRAGDPATVFTVPADGSYILQIRDVQYRGGGDFAYRIEAGEIPLVESILPASGLRGAKVEVTAVGHNLGASATQTVDLTEAEAGTMDLRFATPAGLSNSMPFLVTGVAQVSPNTPHNNAKSAAPVSLPAEVSGVLAKEGEEDFYRFSVATKQPISIEVFARRSGSPVDALITLRDANGNPIEQTNGTGEAEPRISRSFDPGDYIVSIRDLTFGGGPSFGYRLHLLPSAGGPADFALRFLPDAPRVARGSNAKIWCEVVRLNGYKGNINVTLEGLPAGVEVTGGVATLGEQTSGIFTLSAAAEADLGSFPIKLKGVGTFGAQQAVRYGEAELNSRLVRGAYLTVLDKPPFTIDAMVGIRPEQLAAYPAEVQRLNSRLNGPSPELEKAQAEWEKKIGPPMNWTTLEATSLQSSSGSVLTKQPDGSILADAKKSPERDLYTVTAATSLKAITALRLEVLTDPSLPNSGPGRNANGNFVINKVTATVAPKSDPAKTTPVTFTAAKASFEQVNWPVQGAIDDNPGTGWAIMGGTGKAQTAYFFPENSVPAGDVIVSVTLDQQYGEQHTVGRFRLSVTDDANVKVRQGTSLPARVAEAIKIPADQRSPEQKQAVANHYRSISPEMKAEKAKLDALRATVGPFAEVARLDAAIERSSPALDAEQKEWEQSVAAGIGWVPIEIASASSTGATILTKQKDDSVLATGPTPPNDVYTVVGKTSLKLVSAIRLEALPDETLPANGPGRAGGNFVLTRFVVSAANAVATEPGKPAPAMKPTPVAIRDAKASFEQTDWSIAGVLDDKPETGWAVSPLMGAAHAATFTPRVPITGDNGSTLTFTLEFNSPKFQGFTLGRFRFWALGTADSSAANIPVEIRDLLKIGDDKRTPQQKADIAAYYRTISPALEPTRQRLAEVKRSLPPMAIVVAKNKAATIPVPVSRLGEFTGPVQLTMEGFVAGRDPTTRQPNVIAKSLDVTPMSADPESAFVRLSFKPKASSEVGTRMVVIRAEGKIGNDTYVQYSPAFPVTVTEK